MLPQPTKISGPNKVVNGLLWWEEGKKGRRRKKRAQPLKAFNNQNKMGLLSAAWKKMEISKPPFLIGYFVVFRANCSTAPRASACRIAARSTRWKTLKITPKVVDSSTRAGKIISSK